MGQMFPGSVALAREALMLAGSADAASLHAFKHLTSAYIPHRMHFYQVKEEEIRRGETERKQDVTLDDAEADQHLTHEPQI